MVRDTLHLLVAMYLDLLLEVDRKREEPTPLDLHLNLALALPCVEALLRAEHETVVDVCQDYPNGKLATTTKTPITTMTIHCQ